MFLRVSGRKSESADFSLPTQRCFRQRPTSYRRSGLFSAYAEVFLGVYDQGIYPSRFSLPTQRCFPADPGGHALIKLFSAYAEVFLPKPFPAFLRGSFLCLRRGVSSNGRQFTLGHGFSLPTQRCFCTDFLKLNPAQLFSAYAEVFPFLASFL